MNNTKQYDVVIVGGSYAGLAAGMSLGRALRHVLIVDGGKPCNRFVHHAHNLITHDGKAPTAIAAIAKEQVLAYSTVNFTTDIVNTVTGQDGDFMVTTANGLTVKAHKVLFATGYTDVLPDVPGVLQGWGKTIFHCPYCHGYEVHGQRIVVWGNGDIGYEMARLISNWTKDIVLLTDGTMQQDKLDKLLAKGIAIQNSPVAELVYDGEQLSAIRLTDGTVLNADAIFARFPMQQHCPIPEAMGCELLETGQIKVDMMARTTVPGIYAAGDNSSMMRSLATAISSGTAAGATINHNLIEEAF